MNIYPFINCFIEHSYHIFHAIAQKQWEISTNCLFCKLDFYREASLERTSIIYGYDGTALFYKRMCRYISMGVCAPEYSSFIQALQNSFLYNKASVDVISRIWLAGRGTWPCLYVTTIIMANKIKYGWKKRKGLPTQTNRRVAGPGRPKKKIDEVCIVTNCVLCKQTIIFVMLKINLNYLLRVRLRS